MIAPQQAVYKPPSHIKCRFCDKPVFVGDRAVYFHHGVVGRGHKSGQPIVVDGDHTSGEAVLHELCVAPYLTTEIIDSAEDIEDAIDSITEEVFGESYSSLANREQYCDACEAKLEDE